MAVHPVRDRYQEPVFHEFIEGALACGSAFSFVDRQALQVVEAHGDEDQVNHLGPKPCVYRLRLLLIPMSPMTLTRCQQRWTAA
jgi:hypothetical protein